MQIGRIVEMYNGKIELHNCKHSNDFSAVHLESLLSQGVLKSSDSLKDADKIVFNIETFDVFSRRKDKGRLASSLRMNVSVDPI